MPDKSRMPKKGNEALEATRAYESSVATIKNSISKGKSGGKSGGITSTYRSLLPDDSIYESIPGREEYVSPKNQGEKRQLEKREALQKILDNMDGGQLSVIFRVATAVRDVPNPSGQQAELASEVFGMDEGQIKLMSLLAEHFRFANWQPAELYQGHKMSGDAIEFVKRVYAERLTGNFCVSDIRLYDEELYQGLRNKKPEILGSINLPRRKKYYDQLVDEGWILQAKALCVTLNSLERNRK
jgi:hypothetical protein